MSRFIIGATWDDAPHLDPDTRTTLWNSIPPYQRDARTKGIPALGAGVIYPIPEADILIDPFAIPESWPRGFGMDVGWNRTVGIWGAHDRQTNVTYLYSSYSRGEAEPIIHADAWRARGLWIPGKIDPAARQRSQADGERLITQYRKYGLKLQPAQNAVESGIYTVWTGLSTGKIKVFRTLVDWLAEYRLYHRDEKGRVVKKNDHLMDGTRYLVASDVTWFATKPPGWQEDGTVAAETHLMTRLYDEGTRDLQWMA